MLLVGAGRNIIQSSTNGRALLLAALRNAGAKPMDLSRVALYWLSCAGAPPPAAWRRLARSISSADASSDDAAAIFLVAAIDEAQSACAEIRNRIGAEAYIVLVSDEMDEAAAALIGGEIAEVLPVSALARPAPLLKRVKVRAFEKARAARAFAALDRRCGQLQAAIDALPTPIFIKDADVRYVGCNKAFERFIGLPLEAILGKGVYDVAPANLAKRYEEADRALLKAGGQQIYEASVRFADGSNHEVMFHKAVFHDSTGAVAGMAGVMLDIEQRKRVEAALHESEQRYRDVFEHAFDCIALVDVTADGRYILAAANPAARRACGLPDNGVDQPIELSLSEAAAAPFLERLTECVAAQATIRYETLFKGPFGVRTFIVNLAPVAIGDAMRRVIAIARDVTDEREVEKLRSDRERDFRTLVDNSPDTIVRYDRACRRVFSNRSVQSSRNIDPKSILGMTPTQAKVLGDPEQERLYEDWLLAVMAAGEPDERQFIYVRPDGEQRIAVVRAIPERGAGGEVISVLAVGTDADERIKAERQLRQREQDFRTLVEHSPDLIIRYDAQCRRVYINPFAQQLLGVDRVAVGGAPTKSPIVNSEKYLAKLREVLSTGRKGELECSFIVRDGSIRQGHIRIVPEFDDNEKVVGVLAIGRDISEIVESRRKIQRLAFYDSLTELPNRALLSERIAELAARQDDKGAFALMLLDLDRFKEVNDTLGHAVGDELLCKVAARLRRCVRRSDTISRLGGDEFAILLPDAARDRDFSLVAARILRAFAKPFHLSGREVAVSASIGVAESGGEGIDVDTLLKRADSAMYHAKQMGRNNAQFFTPEMTARSLRRMAIETHLRKAIARGELDLYYQPKVALKTARILGAEALLRWRHSELGFLTPDAFIGIAEESGQIVEIGRWVLIEACRRAVEWNRDAASPLQVSVNLSSRQFVMSDPVAILREALAETHCGPDWLELEITESLLLEDNKSVRAMLGAIRDLGVSIAIDDFGTGYSALSYLTRFPISTLKIDRSFISDIERDRKRAELVKAIIGLSTALELKMVAEGVENEAQLDFLLDAGCEEAQGFLFGRPMPEADFRSRLRLDWVSSPLGRLQPRPRVRRAPDPPLLRAVRAPRRL
jgi:diguanylate cyclase (GGDEF)-like protein/PAS domain S-box-containing protein